MAYTRQRRILYPLLDSVSSQLDRHSIHDLEIGDKAMLSWAITFLVIALIAGLLGFWGIAGAAAGIAKILFVVFLVIFLVSLIMGLSRRRV
jgi:uncharacterized membrane protein YtjA (UPF0391 family)